MEQTFSSVRDFLQQHNLTATSTNASDVVATAVLRLSGDPEEESIDTTQLAQGEMEHLRRADPFLYHSIVNDTTGRKVCTLHRAEAGSIVAADAAAGGATADIAHDRGEASFQGEGNVRPRRIPRRSSMPTLSTSHVVRRQRRFSTEEALSNSFLNMMSDGMGNLDNSEDDDSLNGISNAIERVGISHSFRDESNVGELASLGRVDSLRIPRSITMPSLNTTHQRNQQRSSADEQVHNEPLLSQQAHGQSYVNEEENIGAILRVILNERDQEDDNGSRNGPFVQGN
ncbi:hypothetical protein HJC23_011939 [Cyclotella cryptica]|uniref:Uncharacterized protein n=1 Tax=Cyclotella cryptica TaxID=29204 RepID=A0ABD3QQC9_9STRA|eukprot:CCRYP_002974-RA/>CCRYP_002974-RA protein AED:0.21 eAED:0.21 QI:0/-1/0/1/-1/1/1/0/285